MMTVEKPSGPGSPRVLNAKRKRLVAAISPDVYVVAPGKDIRGPNLIQRSSEAKRVTKRWQRIIP